MVAWRNTADFVCKYFAKGSLIALQGRLETRQYQDKSGNNRTAVEIVAEQVSFTGEKVQSAPAAPDPSDDFRELDDSDDLPF